MNKFRFGTKSFNLYDPQDICKNHYEKVYYSWIHEACHWPKEDPQRYYYNSYVLNEPVSIVVEWKVALEEVAP